MTVDSLALDYLALGVCLIWAISVALNDLLIYRISNFSLLFGLVLLYPALLLLGEPFHISLEVLAFAAFVTVAGFSALIGMGDVKLLLLLGPWLQYDNAQFPLILLIGFSWFQIATELVLKRSFPQRIAFAPAILAAAAVNMAT
jgi:Flp pilus assembly protein protease CpaA